MADCGISIGLQDLKIFANSCPSQTLDLSRRELTEVPSKLGDCNDLEVSALVGVKANHH